MATGSSTLAKSSSRLRTTGADVTQKPTKRQRWSGPRTATNSMLPEDLTGTRNRPRRWALRQLLRSGDRGYRPRTRRVHKRLHRLAFDGYVIMPDAQHGFRLTAHGHRTVRQLNGS